MAKKRKIGRPTKVEALIHKIETTVLEMNEKAADSLMEMYSIVETVAKDTTATPASRMKAADWIIARAETFLEEETKEEDDKPTEEEHDFSAPLISSTFSAGADEKSSKSH